MSREFTAITIPSLNGGSQVEAESRGNARGYSVGYSEGIRQAATELADRRTELEAEFAAAVGHATARADRAAVAVDTVIAALNARETPVLTEAHDTLAAASFDLAEAILGSELAMGDTGARAAISRVLGRADGSTVTTVRMNRDDLSVLGDLVLSNPSITFIADPALARGDATADLEHGWLDARIATAAARARAELLGGEPTAASHAHA